MKHKLLKSALCLCLLLPACDNQQKSTTDDKVAEKATPVAITKAEKAPTATDTPEKPQLRQSLNSRAIPAVKTMATAVGKDTTPAAATVDTQKTPAPAATEQQDDTISGKVLETMDSGGYTYLQVDTGKAQQWVAIPQAKVKVGDDVSYHDGVVMPNFTSKSLNRTFDSVVFSTGLVGQADKAAQADPQAHEPARYKTGCAQHRRNRFVRQRSQGRSPTCRHAGQEPNQVAAWEQWPLTLKSRWKKQREKMVTLWKRSLPITPNLTARPFASRVRWSSSAPRSWARTGSIFRMAAGIL